jgi:phage/plasmid primase-like uncharacterized protein
VTSTNGQTSADVPAIKQAARGRWLEIILALTSIPAERLDSKQHGPCPMCGGTDRFRVFDDFQETGGTYCNQCHAEKNGDGISTLEWACGIDFKAAVKMLSDYLGINSNGRAKPSNGKSKAAKEKQLAENAKKIQAISAVSKDTVLQFYCSAKPPITPDGIKKCGGVPVRWGNLVCLRFDGRAPIDSPEPTAIVVCRNDGKPFPPVGKLGERKTHTVGGSVNSWLSSDTPDEIQQAHTVLDVEGLTDLLAAASAGHPPGWVAVTNTSGAKARNKLPRPWAKGKRIIVFGDADEPGQDGQRRSAAAYVQAGAAEVLLAQLPYAIEKDHGKDVRDALNDGHKITDLRMVVVTAEQAAEWSKADPKGQSGAEREITVGPDESRVIDEAIAALATRANVYQRGGCLVHVVEGTDAPRGIARPKESPRIALMRFARIREHLADAATWWKQTGDDERERIHPPDWTIKAIDARGQWAAEIQRLEAVVESPVLRADGTILQDEGYDPHTGIVFRPQVAFPRIAERPTKADAIRAGQMLLEVVEDFPFGSDAHRAAWLASVSTPLARYAYYGPSPLFLIDANVRGSGKSLLTDATSIITTGRAMARMSLPRDDDETRKRITALAVAGEPLILIDNLPAGGFGSPSLDAALTATSWSDRILGQSAMASNIPLYATWYATGNNVILVGDTARRVVHIRLESPEENPEERADFHHSDLLAWVHQERPKLTAAAVTILAAYCAAGRPDMRLMPWGSFEAWSALVRQAIVWAGLPDPGSTRTELTSQADREAVALRQLVAGWEEVDASGKGMTVAAALRELAEYPMLYDTLRDALHELAPPKDGKSLNPRSVGMRLHHLRRRVVGGRYLDQRTEHNTAVWFIGGSSGTRGTTREYAHTSAHTRARENTQGAGNSPPTPPSPTDCEHQHVAETPTHDGYVNRQCRDCGARLACTRQEQPA